MFARQKFQNTLGIVLVLFTTAICLLYSVVLLVGVNSAENHMVTKHLHGELQRISHQYQSLGQTDKALVDTEFAQWLANATPCVSEGIQIYTADSPNLPGIAKTLPEGAWDIPGIDVHYLSSYIGKHRVILLFDERDFFEEDRVESVLTLSLSLFSLVLILISLGVSLLISKKIAAPIASLSERLNEEKPFPPFDEEQRRDEIGELARSFSSMVLRLNGFLEREKQFTRHSSHELRTPVTIIANCLSVLKLPTISPEKKARNLERIGKALIDMNDLIETFLVLGREEGGLGDWEWLEVDLILLSSLEKLAPSDIQFDLKIHAKPRVQADQSMLTILLDNLLKNAITYSRDQLHIELSHNKLTIKNDIEKGYEPPESYGFGLEIVNRIIDRLNWRFEVSQGPTHWLAEVHFPKKE